MLYHEIHGQGPELVLIGGFTCDHTHWATILPILSAHFKVLIFDNWGSGQSPQEDRPYSLEQMADDTLELVKSVGFTKPHFLGHSMGGAIVQEIGAREPDMGKLVICNSFYKIRRGIHIIFEGILKRKERGDDERELFEAVVPWLFADGFLEKVSLDQMFTPSSQTFVGFKRQLEVLCSIDTRPLLSKIKDPSLIIGAKEDFATLPSESEYLAEHISNAQLALLDGVGHSAPVENPEGFCQPILDFLA